MRNRKRVVVDTTLFERVNKLLLINNINGNLSSEEKELNPKTNDSIDIASVQFNNGNIFDIKLCSDDEEYYLCCTLNDADGKKLRKFDNLYYLDKHLLFHHIDVAHKINTYEIDFSLCDIETLKLGAVEIQEVLDFYEANKDKSFEFFCDYFDANVEDIRSEEDIEVGEEPWLEASVCYKHLEFNMHEEEIIPDVIGIQNGDNYEDLDICEFWYGLDGQEKSPKYYKLWLPKVNCNKE